MKGLENGNLRKLIGFGQRAPPPGLQNLSFIGGPAQVLIFGERSDGGRIKGAQRLREEKFRRFSFKIVDFHRFSSKFAAIHAPARLRPR